LSLLLPIDRIERRAAHHHMDHSVHFNFNSASFAPREGRLHLGDDDVILEQKVADLLHAFCRRPGQVLTKTWLMEEIWPGRVVNEDSLSVAVSKLRRVLGDQAAAPKYIRTVTGTGYIWLPETRHVSAETDRPYSAAGSRTGWWLSSALVGLGLLVAALGGWWVTRDHVPATPSTSNESSLSGEPNAEVGRLLEQAQERLDSDQPELLRQSIAEFREVLEEEPDNIAAHLGIAEAKVELSGTEGYLDIELYADEVRALLERVLKIDPDNARAWRRKAQLHLLADWAIEPARYAYLRAIEADPNDPMSYLHYTEFLLTLGEFEQAEVIVQEMREVNPGWFRYENMSYVYYMRGELERALAETRRLINSEPESDYAQRMLHRTTLLLGEDDTAFEQLVRLMGDAGLEQPRIDQYGAFYRSRGMAALFGRLLDDRLEANIGHYIPPMSWARYAVVAGRHDEAFRWLNEAVEERQPQILLVNVDPHYLPLRNDPRFAELLGRLPQRAGDSKNAD
jgi:DNA-binding winged helix-turn-helix (wHTH) protein/tetratricopeptide (TPR) repeat protein